MHPVILSNKQLRVILFKICISSVVYPLYLPRGSKKASKKYDLKHNLKLSRTLEDLSISNAEECNATRSLFHTGVLEHLHATGNFTNTDCYSYFAGNCGVFFGIAIHFNIYGKLFLDLVNKNHQSILK